MGYTWILEILMLIADVRLWHQPRKEREQVHRPLPKISGSVPHVPLRKQQSFNGRCATF